MANVLDQSEIVSELRSLKVAVERLEEQVRQREDDFSVVRSNASKVPTLEEQLREISRSLSQLSGRSGTVQKVDAPASQPLPQNRGEQVDSGKITKMLFERLKEAGQLPTIDDARKIIAEEVGKQVKQGIDLEALAKRIYKEISTVGVEDRLAKYLKDQVARDVDTKAIIRAIVEELLKQFKIEEMNAQIVEGLVKTLASSLEVRRRQGY